MRRLLLALVLMASPAVADMQAVTDTVSVVAIATPTVADHSGKAALAWAKSVTITSVRCSVWSTDDTGTVTIQLVERAATAPNTGGTDVMSTTLVCDDDQEEAAAGESVTITNAAIEPANLVALTISAVGGTDQKSLWVFVEVQ